jgi:hypothetical protein
LTHKKEFLDNIKKGVLRFILAHPFHAPFIVFKNSKYRHKIIPMFSLKVGSWVGSWSGSWIGSEVILILK